MLHHGVDAIGIHVLVFVFYCLVERSSERLGLQTAAKQHVAPVKHVECVGIRGTIQVHITALRIDIASQQLECHPVREIFGIEIFAENVAHRH